ncbi:MAG: DUF192 domain-containing protein [Candidatus Omnitrophica bacterium]|nr:DUF192 domain-containing protein [Candidatus Omnitrophota bacterium]
MFRNNLEENRGMLFIFEEEDIYPFWMKNTFIPLDIIWINEDREVVFIKHSAQPCKEERCPSIYPDKKARFVLELKGGTAKKIGLNSGDKIDFTNIINLL